MVIIMKRFISLCLTLVLVFALAVPLSALAEEETQPPEASSPEASSPEAASPEASSPEASPAEPSPPEPSPPAASPAPRGAAPLWEEWGAGSLEEFLMWMEMTEEEYYKFEAEQRQYREDQIRREEEYLQEYRQRRIKDFEELGGTYGAINIMLNGEFVSFAGAAPEITGGLLYAPTVPFFEAMGATVGYDSQTRGIAAEFPDKTLYFALGQDTMTIEEDGEGRELPIGAAVYAKNGSSYLPVRAVSEALGFDVYWDSEFKTAVILDAEMIIAEIDESFTIANKLFEAPIEMIPKDASAYKTVIGILVSITQFDSINGDKNVDVGADISIHSDGSSFYAKGAADLSGLLEFILGAYGYYVFSPDEIKEMTDVLDAISASDMELIYNYDKDILYAKIPFLHLLVPEVPENSWISVSDAFEQMFGADVTSVMEELGLDELVGGMSVGRLIYMENTDYVYGNQVYLFSAMLAEAEELKALMGDERFVRNGADYTLTLTQGDIGDIYYYNSRFDFTLTLSTRDGAVTGISGSLVYGMGYYTTETQISADFGISAGSLAFSIEIHERNAVKVRVDVGAEVEATDEPVPKAPPAGEDVIAIEELFPDEYDRPAIMPVSDKD